MSGFEKIFIARFWSKVSVKKVRQCWEWKSSIAPNGYGKISFKNYPLSAHRVSYEIFYGKIHDGLYVDHICMNRCCVNPHHLRLVTPAISATENTNGTAAKNKHKTHCIRGHLFNDNNTFFKKVSGRGVQRVCRICRLDNQRNATAGRRAREVLAKYNPAPKDE